MPRQGNKLGLTACCGLCLIAAIAGDGQTQFSKLSGLRTSWPQENLN